MIISIAQAQLFFLALTRILAMIIHVPVLGGQSIPNQVRLAFGIVLTAILIPWQPLPADAASLGLLGFAISIGKEIMIGTLAGFAASLTFGAIEIAGEVMGLGSGFSSGRIFNPAMSESGAAYNQLFVMVSMMVFLLLDGHHLFIIAMQKTFVVIPVNGAIPLDSFNVLAKMTSQLIAAGIQLALPVMAALTIADMSLGFLAKVAPQVQIYFLGLPLKVGIALFSLGMFFSVGMQAVTNIFQSVGPRMLQLLAR
jgi:flagellar biosynthesis protein FliR